MRSMPQQQQVKSQRTGMLNERACLRSPHIRSRYQTSLSMSADHVEGGCDAPAPIDRVVLSGVSVVNVPTPYPPPCQLEGGASAPQHWHLHLPPPICPIHIHSPSRETHDE